MAVTLSLLRPDDLLNLRIEGENLRVDASKPDHPVLVLENAQKPGYLIVHFPPQTVAEQAVFESAPAQPPPDEAGDPYNANHPPQAVPPQPAQARIGGPSRLVFRITPGPGVKIPYTTAGLLDWDALELVVTPLADVPSAPSAEQIQQAPGIQEPGRLETAVELPYRLVLSPNHAVAWRSAAQPKTHRGFTELWHARMAHKAEDGALSELTRANPAPMRAIWSPDYNADKFKATDPPIFAQPDVDWGVLTPMTPSDRHEIVVLTSAFHGYVLDKDDYRGFVPSPVLAERFILSPLGGWLKSRGEWDPPAPFRPLRVFEEIDRQRWDRYVEDLSRMRLPRGFSVESAMEDAGNEGIPNISEELRGSGDAAEARAPEVLFPGALGHAGGVKLVGTEIGGVLWPQLLGTTGDLLNMSEWTHIATLGRDHFVRIVYEGHLYPFGHRASLIKITERKIRDVKRLDGTTTPLAYLVQRMFIVVRQPLRDYTDPAVHAHLEDDGLGLPFKNVRLTTLVTPDIANPPDGSQIPGTTYSFWVRLGKGDKVTDDFKFHAIAEDLAGNPVNFTASLIFIPFGEGFRETVFDQYQKSGESRACVIPGQKVTYAPAAPGNENTALATNRMYFKTHTAPVNKKFGGFLPKLHMASVNLPAVEAMLGKSAATSIGYYDPYLKQASGNTTGLFASIVKEASPGVLAQDKLLSEFSADQAGGFATPNLSISGLTSTLGPLAGDLGNAAGDIFDPSDFFNDVKDAAKLFGTLSLADLLGPLTMGAGAPKIQFNKEVLPAAPPAQKIKLITTLDWTPALDSGGLELGIVSFHPKKNGTDAKLEVKGRVEKIVELPPPAVPDPGLMKMDGALTNFTIEMLHVVEVLFNEFSFHAQTGKKLDVKVDLDHETPVRFIDDLEFVDELRKVIPPELFGDGPSLDINLTRIKAGFSIGLPPVSVGVFSLREVTLAAFLELPFIDGRPTFDFSFSSREHPFNLTVMLFGGGGFFHLQIDTLGIKLLEAALEFGASASVDLGVASGSVYIMAGIYFSMQRKVIEGVEVDAATLAGYLRMGGELSILGLISVALEFYLTFAYEAAKNAAYGRATLTVKVEVLFFSKSVEITVEKRFGGSSGDPYFLEAFTTPAVWDEYAGAFA